MHMINTHLFFFLLCLIPLKAICSLPVDVSYLIVDVKYHPTRGAQICEIQHGVYSGYRGNIFLYEEHERIQTKLLGHLSSYYENSWVTPSAFADEETKRLLSKNPKWTCTEELKDIEGSKSFLSKATKHPKDTFSLKSYGGFVFISPKPNTEREEFRDKYPGVVLIDNAFSGYAHNKLSMTKLLMGDPYTEEHKPVWGHYYRDEKDLVEKILNDIPSKLLVIKPVDEFLGTGVIILKREDLKETLDYLFDTKRKKPTADDPAYEYWGKKKATELLVEEFIESEPIAVSHLEGKLFSPTIRLSFLLFFDKNGIRIECLGGYYNLPSVSISQKGSLNEIHKSACRPPFYEKVDPELMNEATTQIKKVLYIVYQKLLGQ